MCRVARRSSPSGRKATEKKLCFLVDFQTRADEFYIEALKRVHAGAIGKFAFGEASYHAENPFGEYMDALRKDPHSAEVRLRAWGLDRALSGDIITEQNIHTLDVASWIMDQPPLCAFGTGARKVRDAGTCCDTFSVVFLYPDNVGITFSSRQIESTALNPKESATACSARRASGDRLRRAGSHSRQELLAWRQNPQIYQQGAVSNIATFHASIQHGDSGTPPCRPAYAAPW